MVLDNAAYSICVKEYTSLMFSLKYLPAEAALINE